MLLFLLLTVVGYLTIGLTLGQRDVNSLDEGCFTDVFFILDSSNSQAGSWERTQVIHTVLVTRRNNNNELRVIFSVISEVSRFIVLRDSGVRVGG